MDALNVLMCEKYTKYFIMLTSVNIVAEYAISFIFKWAKNAPKCSCSDVYLKKIPWEDTPVPPYTHYASTWNSALATPLEYISSFFFIWSRNILLAYN